MAEEGRQIEQYIYSRADRVFNNNGVELKRGYGFVAESPGMDTKLRNSVRSYCSQFPPGGAVKGDLKNFPVFQKVYLPQVKRLLLQHNIFLDSDRLASGKRGLFVANGYIVPREIPGVVNPVKCFMLPYTKDDPNETEGSIGLKSLEKLNPDKERIREICPLSKTMKVLGLEKDVFKQLLLACFDALTDSRQILIAYDFSSEGWEASLYKVLFWIFSCLPYELRLKLGADSVYTEASIPGATHIAFADKTVIKLPKEGVSAGKRVTGIHIKIGGKPESLRRSFLFYENELFSNPVYKCKWLYRRSIFTKWLEAVVDELWEEENWVQDVNYLDYEYVELQKMLKALPEKDRLNPEQYDAACWQLIESPERYFSEAAEKVHSEATEDEIRACSLTALNGGVGTLDNENIERSFKEIIKDPKAPISKENIMLVASLVNRNMREYVFKYLCVFIDMDLAAPDLDVVKTLEKYKECTDSGTFAYLIKRVFFGSEGKGNAKELRKKWYKAKLDKNLSLKAAWKSLSFINTELQKLLTPLSETKYYKSEYFEITKKEMSEEWADMLHEQIGRGTEKIFLNDVLEFVKEAAEYQDDVMWKAITRATVDMTDKCIIPVSSACLEEFEDIQSAFQKVKSGIIFEKCRFALIKKEYDTIKEHGGLKNLAVPDERLTERLRAIEGDIPKTHKYGFKKIVEEMFLEVYDILFDDPKPFMDSEWLIKEAESRPCREGSEKLLKVLSEIAKNPDAGILTLEHTAKLNNDEMEKCGKILINMYLRGLLPELGVVIVAELLHEYSASRDQLLKRFTEQGGGKQLLSLLKSNRDGRAAIPYRESNDFIETLKDVSGNSELLDIAEKSAENESFDEKLIDFTIESYGKNYIGKETAESITGKLYEHYKSRHRANLTLKHKAEKLVSDPGGLMGMVGSILKKK